MSYLKEVEQLASQESDVDPARARAALDGAREELGRLSDKVRRRHLVTSDPKPRSEYTMEEKAAFFSEQRAAGLDPNEEWGKLPS